MINPTNFRSTRVSALIIMAALTLFACSEAPTEKIEGEIIMLIDQKVVVVNEKFSKIEALEKHTELLDAFETACLVGFFLESTVESHGVSSFSRSTPLALKEIALTDHILTCQSGRLRKTVDNRDRSDFPGCSIRTRGEGDTQKQYLFALRDYLNDRHKMKEKASLLHSIRNELRDRETIEMVNFYTVEQNTLTCTKEVSTATNDK